VAGKSMIHLKEIQADLKALLPEQAKWQFKEEWVAFDFSRLEHSLSRVTDEQIVGGTMPADWQKYRVFGDEVFSNGCAFVCIDETDGAVRRIDVELETPLGLFATNTASFTTTFRLLNEYFASRRQTPDMLAKQLRLADVEAYDAGSHWRLLSDYLNSNN
jgi:hypothetical protein